MEWVEVERKDGTKELIQVFSWDEVPLDDAETAFQISPHGKGHDKIAYLCDFMTFDIESTTMPGKQRTKTVKHKDGSREKVREWVEEPWSFMYHFQVCVGGRVVFGRRWEEFFNLLARIREAYKVKSNKRLVCFVFNLGFEFQFLYSFLWRKYGRENVQIFATASRQPIKIVLPDGIELRCAWKLTNMNLYMFTKTEIDCPYLKPWTDLDYRKIRTPETPLTMKEKGYCVIDVLGLYYALKSRMKADKDTIISLPLTSTGYPRRDCRKACRRAENYREEVFKRNLLTMDVYDLLEEMKRGGDTHANRFLAGKIRNGVDPYDYVSEYPAAMLLYDFPAESFRSYGIPDTLQEFEEVMDGSRACIARVTFQGIKVKDDTPMPYIPIDKIWRKAGKIWGDNGRVLSSEGYISITINEIDWQIIKECYEWDEGGLLVETLYVAKKAPLPAPLRNTILSYFAIKCELKEAIAAAEEALEADPDNGALISRLNDLNYRYGKIKNKLNGIFGMCYTNVIKLENVISPEGEWKEELPQGKTKEDLLQKYNTSRNSFLVYAWGPWVTAYGRMMLRALQDCARDPQSGRKVVCYSDTDSAKSESWDQERLAALTNKMCDLARQRGAVYVSKSGTEYLMGYPEKEKTHVRFVTLGAKKYAYEDPKGNLHVTVSGVSNVHKPGDPLGMGARELSDHGGLEAFRVGFIFKEAGGSLVWYSKHIEPHEVTVDGCTFETASYAAITDGEYTLGQTDEYKKLLGSL